NVFIGRKPFEFNHPGWYVQKQTRGAVSAEIREAFEARLKSYLDHVAEQARARGWDRTPEKRGESHFAWVVRYQVHFWEPERIHEEYHTQPGSVKQGIRKTAHLLRLTLREASSGGRPKGSRKKKTRRIDSPS